jgi:hypothetical protein
MTVFIYDMRFMIAEGFDSRRVNRISQIINP